eukprot:TRINITY_DN2532_c0_g1_i13.p1 TRINITY_DN2532_c0_g1~~TRINITY_DN2532_c0_g1_i13.p1  ORF type:complete len:1112 (+),score=145.42 TRINITY_DN2532_c0_g1_i13:58-3393(+)
MARVPASLSCAAWAVLLHGVGAASLHDECTLLANWNACARHAPTQNCVDPDKSISANWQCRCPAPTYGMGAQAPAQECKPLRTYGSTYDECTDCPGSAKGAAEVDYTLFSSPTLDTIPGIDLARCTEQCLAYGEACSALTWRGMQTARSYQNCFVGAACCVLKAQNTRTRKVALKGSLIQYVARDGPCNREARTDPQGLCEQNMQRCHDPTKGTGVTKDWVCRCATDATITAPQALVGKCPGATTVGRMSMATQDECSVANQATCASGGQGGQVCFDPDITTTNDWQCRCVGAGMYGTGYQGQAVCKVLQMYDPAFDECFDCPNEEAGRIEDKALLTGFELDYIPRLTEDECLEQCLANAACAALHWRPMQAAPIKNCYTGASCCFLTSSRGNSITAEINAVVIFITQAVPCHRNLSTDAQGICEFGGQTCNDPTSGTNTTRDWECACGPNTRVQALAPCPSSAPPTPSPPTPAPPTLSPPSPAPPTSAPPSPAPPTPSPPSPAPSTSAPPTPAPPTPSPFGPATLTPPIPTPSVTPATPVPSAETTSAAPNSPSPAVAVPSPPSPSPPQHTPQPTPSPTLNASVPLSRAPVIASSEAVAALLSENKAGAATSALVGVASGAGPVLRLAAVAQRCDPGHFDEAVRYGSMMSPLQLEVSGSRALGAVVGNCVLAAGAGLLGWCVAALGRAVGSRVLPSLFLELDAAGVMLFPSAPLLVFQVLYQGITLGAMDLVVHGPSAWLTVAGLCGLVVCVAVPGVVLMFMTAEAHRGAYIRSDAGTSGGVKKFMLGRGEWVSRRKDWDFANRWSSVLRQFNRECVYYPVVEFAASFALSGLQSLTPEDWTGCGHVKMFACVVFVVLLVLEMTLWPHLHGRNSMFDVMQLGGQAAAMGALAAGYYSGDEGHGGFEVGGRLLMYAFVVILLRCVFDVAAWVWVVVSGRRRRLQREAWAGWLEGMSAGAALVVAPSPHASDGAGPRRGSWTTMASCELTLLCGERSDPARDPFCAKHKERRPDHVFSPASPAEKEAPCPFPAVPAALVQSRRKTSPALTGLSAATLDPALPPRRASTSSSACALSGAPPARTLSSALLRTDLTARVPLPPPRGAHRGSVST